MGRGEEGKRGRETLDRLIKRAGDRHILNHYEIDLVGAILLVPELLERAGFGEGACGPANPETCLEELVGDMRAEIAIDTCHEDDGVCGNCKDHDDL